MTRSSHLNDCDLKGVFEKDNVWFKVIQTLWRPYALCQCNDMRPLYIINIAYTFAAYII